MLRLERRTSKKEIEDEKKGDVVIKHEYEPTVETGGGWVGLMTTSPNIFILIFAHSFKTSGDNEKILLKIFC
jgi:hypothetical protein